LVRALSVKTVIPVTFPSTFSGSTGGFSSVPSASTSLTSEIDWSVSFIYSVSSSCVMGKDSSSSSVMYSSESSSKAVCCTVVHLRSDGSTQTNLPCPWSVVKKHSYVRKQSLWVSDKKGRDVVKYVMMTGKTLPECWKTGNEKSGRLLKFSGMVWVEMWRPITLSWKQNSTSFALPTYFFSCPSSAANSTSIFCSLSLLSVTN
jgi:hypothetical protein